MDRMQEVRLVIAFERIELDLHVIGKALTRLADQGAVKVGATTLNSLEELAKIEQTRWDPPQPSTAPPEQRSGKDRRQNDQQVIPGLGLERRVPHSDRRRAPTANKVIAATGPTHE